MNYTVTSQYFEFFNENKKPNKTHNLSDDSYIIIIASTTIKIYIRHVFSELQLKAASCGKLSKNVFCC